MKFKTKQTIKRTMYQVSIFIQLLALCSSIALFFIGFHNVDLSVNVMRISMFENLDYNHYSDTTLNGSILNYDCIYILGLKQMFIAMLCLTLLICNYIASLIINYKGGKNKHEK